MIDKYTAWTFILSGIVGAILGFNGILIDDMRFWIIDIPLVLVISHRKDLFPGYFIKETREVSTKDEVKKEKSTIFKVKLKIESLWK